MSVKFISEIFTVCKHKMSNKQTKNNNNNLLNLKHVALLGRARESHFDVHVCHVQVFPQITTFSSNVWKIKNTTAFFVIQLNPPDIIIEGHFVV